MHTNPFLAVDGTHLYGHDALHCLETFWENVWTPDALPVLQTIHNLDLTLPAPADRISFSLDDVQQVLRELPSRKAGDGDGVAHEAVKMLDEPCQLALLTAFNELLHSDSPQPASWQHCLVLAPPGGYRPIALTACFSKIFSRLLLRTLTASMHAFDDWRVGFRRGSSCTHLNWPLRMIAEKCREWQEPVAFPKVHQPGQFATGAGSRRGQCTR
eukprot:6487496-Amphidinium_carterae.4